MSKKNIEKLLKTALTLLCLTGVLCCVMMGRITEYILPGFSSITHRLWLYSLYICAVPCFLSLIPAWNIATQIGSGKSFCKENVKNTRLIGVFMVADTALVLITNTLLFCIGRSFAALFASFSLIISLLLAVSVCAFAFSTLLENATSLQEQSDYTI